MVAVANEFAQDDDEDEEDGAPEEKRHPNGELLFLLNLGFYGSVSRAASLAGSDHVLRFVVLQAEVRAGSAHRRCGRLLHRQTSAFVVASSVC